MFFILTHEEVAEKMKAVSMEKHFNADNMRAIALGIAADTIIIEATEAAYAEKLKTLGITDEQIENCKNTLYVIMSEAMKACHSCDKHCSALIRIKSSPFMETFFCEKYALACVKETNSIVEKAGIDAAIPHEEISNNS